MAGKFLNLFSPFVRITPEIKQPDREISFKDKLIYTLVILVLYIIMSNTPLFGLPATEEGVDYYFWLRTILASQRGTLTEMGIGPIVTAGLIMQLLQGSKMINVNMADPSDRALFTGAQKVIAVFLTIFQIIAYLAGGAFGAVGVDLSISYAIAIFIQLLSAGLLIMLMDEVLQKGYGLGSGVSLFIASGVAGQIFWNALGPMSSNGAGADLLPQGIIIAFFSVLFTDAEIPGPSTDAEGVVTAGHRLFEIRGEGSFFKVGDLWIREAGAPGLLGLFLTLIIFGIVIYVETMRVEIPLTYAGYKGYRGKYPMKLLYVSNIPVILAQALYANFLFFGQLIWNKAKDSTTWKPIAQLIGSFEQAAGSGDTASHMTPTGGLIYFLTPPQGLSALITKIRDFSSASGEERLWEIIAHPIIYLILFITICIFFGKIWVEVSGLAPRDIAGQIINSKMQIPGFRRSEKVIEKILKRYIPTLTILCGFIVGILSFTADFLGCLSSGTGLLLSVGIVQNYAETISKEAASEQYPGMRGLLGN